MSRRLERCWEAMASQEIQALVVTDLENVRYLTGFTGSAGACLLTTGGGFFVTDGRYIHQAAQEVKELEVRIDQEKPPVALNQLIKEAAAPVGIEADHVSVAQYRRWEEEVGPRFKAVSGLVEGLRQIKDQEEIALIEQAVGIVDNTFQQILQFLRVGLTEREVAMEIDFTMRRLGATREAFDTIAASGPNSARPHAHPTDRALQIGDLVTLDFGALYNSYNSDLTRTIILGKPGGKQQEIYAAVLEAQLKAIHVIRPGVKGKDVDAAARDSIAAAGYGECFTHGLGHSLGRTVHDGPGLGKNVENELVPGMVLTVEPGVYLEGFGGVRIEDDIVVTEDGCKILTQSPKELLCV